MGFAITIKMFIATAQLPMSYFDFLHLLFFLMFLPCVSVLAPLPLALKYATDKDFALPHFHLVEHDVPTLPESVVLDEHSLIAV
jgi:hypothetical protein